MKRFIILLAILLVAGCTKEEEKDWLIGKWYVSSCTYVNGRTGEKGRIDNPGFNTWEFTERGKVFIDGDRKEDYWHKDGRIKVGSVLYYEVLHRRDLMQLEERNQYSVTTFTFQLCR